MTEKISVETTIGLPPSEAWKLWTSPKHIVHWNFASEDWCAPSAENDLRTGGRFSFRMESRDGAHGFDFEGHYTEVLNQQRLSYEMADGRKATVEFTPAEGGTRITEIFEAENVHPIEMQRAVWQAILNNFKRYAESQRN